MRIDWMRTDKKCSPFSFWFLSSRFVSNGSHWRIQINRSLRINPFHHATTAYLCHSTSAQSHTSRKFCSRCSFNSKLLQVQFLWACSPRDEVAEILHRVYPDLDASDLTITGIANVSPPVTRIWRQRDHITWKISDTLSSGSVSTLGPHTSASTLYICILPIIAYAVIILMRRKVRR